MSAVTITVLALATGPAIAATTTGPSTSTTPYVLPIADGVDITSLFTVGDDRAADNGYEMVGIPDGLGAVERGGTRIVYMNHELRDNAGVVRAHGERGAFVSRLEIDAQGRVRNGRDWISEVTYYNYGTGGWSEVAVAPAGAAPGTHTNAFSRFCSGFLSEPGQLYRESNKRGYDGQIYFANEESGDEGRVFGVVDEAGTATGYQLPRLGLLSWENTVVAPSTKDRTVVMGNEDGGIGQLRVYSGTKQRNGSAVERAGLTDGSLHVVRVDGVADATTPASRADAGFTKGVSRLFSVPEIDWNANGAAQNAEALAKGTTLNRIEDGSFDPQNPNDYYFLTTEGGDRTPRAEGGASRDGGGLWRLSFKDADKPEKGGTLTLLLDGTEAPYLNKPDNVTIDRAGNVLIQEDPGGNAHLARIVAYRISDGELGVLAQFDPTRFLAGSSGLITQDEESSGIIQLDDGSFLFDAQVHAPSGDPATVERGQLLHMTVSDWSAVYGG